MPEPDSWCDRSASDQARAIAAGVLGSPELMQAQQERIAHRNHALNAFIRVESLSDIRSPQISSPLAGTSFAVKDNIDVAGTSTRAGLQVLDGTPASADAPVVKRLRDAGLHLTGRLNMAPLALGASTRNPDFGDCFNPVLAGHSAGGSSGGSASAVAAGLVSLALGTDTMGSVRLPAAWCGIVGFKPTWGHIPAEGVVPLSRLLDHVGVLCRSVEDARAAYQILASRTESAGATRVDTQTNDAPLTIAVPDDLPALQLDAAVLQSFEQALEQIRQAGISVEPVSLRGLPFSPTRRAGLQLCEAELLDWLAPVFPSRRDAFPATLIQMLDYIAARSAADLARMLNRLLDARQWLDRLFGSTALLALPTTAHLAIPMSEPDPADSADLTAPANVLGAPAISLPLPPGANGLSAGFQLVGRRHQDFELLAAAARLETLFARR